MCQLLAGLIVAASFVGPGAPRSDGVRAITGQLVDAACYRLDKSHIGADHKMPQGDEKNCAVECVKTGLPVALLALDGTVYIVTGVLAASHNADLVPHMGHTVTLTGEVTEEAGTMMIAAMDLKMIER
jgi:hypothetical protein